MFVPLPQPRDVPLHRVIHIEAWLEVHLRTNAREILKCVLPEMRPNSVFQRNIRAGHNPSHGLGEFLRCRCAPGS